MKGNKKNFKKRAYGNKDSYKARDVKDREDRVSSEETGHKFNDVSWYTKNDQMLKDAASYSYNRPIGYPLPSPFPGVQQYNAASAVPGIMSLWISPVPGVSQDANSPANLAANNIYAYVRYMNSGAKNYDQADLMLYLLAMDSMYYMWNWGKRIYGYMTQYSQYNIYLPKGIAEADCIDWDSFYANPAEFRYYLNMIAAKISSFCVPAVMPFFIRHSWMFSNIYKDSDSNKAQMYMFTPTFYYVYDETGSKYGGQLVAKRLKSISSFGTASGRLTYTQYKAAMDSMVNAVSYSEDIGVMSGDILKAYGQEKLFKLAPVTEDYTVTPVYNEEVLNQIHNSNILPAFIDGAINETNNNFTITQDPNTGFLKWLPVTTTSVGQSELMTPSNYMINMPWDDVTPANTMVGTRLTCAYTISTDKKSLTVEACGTEVVNRQIVLTQRTDGQFHSVSLDASDWFIDVTNLTTSLFDLVAFTRFSNFDWHPLYPIIAKNDNGTTYIGRLGDINNYTVMTPDDLANLHLTAILSEFNIPQLGSF